MTTSKKKKTVLITMGHCSSFVPKEIRNLMALTDFEIAEHSDIFTDLIYNVPDCHMVKAKISRLVVDMNRAPDDIAAEMELCESCVVTQISAHGKIIYKQQPTYEMILSRVEKYHKVFHKEVGRLTKKVKFLIDGHSMWSIAPKTKLDAGQARVDICLGNRRFATCDASITNYFKTAFERFGYSVSVNKPYEGAFILGYHCHRKRLPGIQIEINKKLYINEKTLKPKAGKIKEMNGRLREIVAGLREYL